MEKKEYVLSNEWTPIHVRGGRYGKGEGVEIQPFLGTQKELKQLFETCSFFGMDRTWGETSAPKTVYIFFDWLDDNGNVIHRPGWRIEFYKATQWVAKYRKKCNTHICLNPRRLDRVAMGYD